MELKHKEIVAKLEGRAFYMGFPLAMGFAAGECSLCLPHTTCSVLNGQDCSHPPSSSAGYGSVRFRRFQYRTTGRICSRSRHAKKITTTLKYRDKPAYI
ncbi:MAG: DUF2284 domain-containing protein [Desulfobacterales bacterium]